MNTLFKIWLVFFILIAGTASFRAETYSIDFNKGTTNGTSISSDFPKYTTTLCKSGSENISTINKTYCYYNANGCGIRLASALNMGELTITFSDEIKNAIVTEVIVYASATREGAELTIKPSGTNTSNKIFNNLTLYSSNKSNSNNYQLESIQINGTLNSLTISNVAGYYVHLHKITINTQSAPETQSHTARFSVNGIINPEWDSTVKEGEKITFPSSKPGNIYEKTFVGWSEKSDTDDDFVVDDEPSLVATKNMGTEDITFYAVFATKRSNGESSMTLTKDDFKNTLTNSYSSKTISKTLNNQTYSFEINAMKHNNMAQFRDDATDLSYLYIPELPGDITSISTTSCANASAQSYTGTIHIKSSKTRGNTDTDDVASLTATRENPIDRFNINIPQGHTSVYLLTSSGLLLQDLTVTFENIIYSDYSTIVLPPSYSRQTITMEAVSGDDYYATFSNQEDVFIPATNDNNDYETTVYTVSVDDMGIVSNPLTLATVTIDEKEHEGYFVPKNNAVLIRTAFAEGTNERTISFYTVENKSLEALHNQNMLIPCTITGPGENEEGYRYYKLAYGSSNKTALGFWWGAENGAGGFKVKAGGAVLKIAYSVEASVRNGFTFGSEGTTTGLNNTENRKNAFGKYLRNGNIVIRMNRQEYNTNGQLLKTK